jgi:uncharacterized membrane protein YfcA
LTYSYAVTLLIVCPLILLAGFVDSIAGGGGLIAIPAYLFAGVPIKTTYGSNKFAMSFGATMSSINYIRGGCVNARAAICGSLAALLGAWLGTMLAIRLSADVLQICLIVLMPVAAVFMLTNRRFDSSYAAPPLSKEKTAVFSACIGLVIGAYDGFFGPGAGMFYTLTLAGIVHLDLVKATGTCKVINLASGISSAATFFFDGDILFSLAVPAMVCAVAGSFLGSKLAIKIGPKFIRPVLVIVAGLLFIKILGDIIGQYTG